METLVILVMLYIAILVTITWIGGSDKRKEAQFWREHTRETWGSARCKRTGRFVAIPKWMR